MFIDEIFDVNMSKTAYFKPVFDTSINTVINKLEHRQAKWQAPRNCYTIPTQNLKLSEYQKLMNLFNVCKGKLGSFKFKNQFDFSLENLELSYVDEYVEIFKIYEIGSHKTKKLIKALNNDTLSILINNQKFYDFEIINGKIKLNYNLQLEDNIVVTGEFFDVVRFDTDYLNAKFISQNNIEISEFNLIEA